MIRTARSQKNRHGARAGRQNGHPWGRVRVIRVAASAALALSLGGCSAESGPFVDGKFSEKALVLASVMPRVDDGTAQASTDLGMRADRSRPLILSSRVWAARGVVPTDQWAAKGAATVPKGEEEVPPARSLLALAR